VVVFRLDYAQEDRERQLVRGTARVRLVPSKHEGRIAIVGESN